jgi:hypothetical protein
MNRWKKMFTCVKCSHISGWNQDSCCGGCGEIKEWDYTYGYSKGWKPVAARWVNVDKWYNPLTWFKEGYWEIKSK